MTFYESSYLGSSSTLLEPTFSLSWEWAVVMKGGGSVRPHAEMWEEREGGLLLEDRFIKYLYVGL